MSGGLLRLVVGGALACATVWPVAAWAQASASLIAPAMSATTSNVPPSPADAGGKAAALSPGTLTRAALGATGVSRDWQNEIHPRGVGYAKLAAVWRPVLEKVLSA